MKCIISVILINFLTFNSSGQIIIKPGPDVWAVHDANIDYTRPKGWKELDTAFNDKPLTYDFLYKCIARWGLYNPEKDMYMILGTRWIRSFSGHLSDSAANNFYLSREYLMQDDLIPLKEDLVSPAMLKEANVDDVASYRMKLDTPFLGKYHYAKQFLLHRQDVAEVTLNFVALNKSKEGEINQAFKEMWGMIRFRPDSAFHPEFKFNLVGKFRHLRPKLNTEDSLTNVRNRKRMYYMVAMFNGKSAVKAKKYKSAKESFLKAHHIFPSNPNPYEDIFELYISWEKFDSATVYLNKLEEEYLPQKPKLAKELKYGRAMLYAKEGRYKEALKIERELLKIDPGNAIHIYFGIAEDNRNLRAYQTAIEKYKKVQQLHRESKHPESAYCNYLIGICYAQLSNKKLAKKYFKKAQEGGYDLPEDIEDKFEL